jgi:hypothetical protein
VTGYQPAGREVRADTTRPRAASFGGTPQSRAPFRPPQPRPATGRPALTDQDQDKLRQMGRAMLDARSAGPERDPWTATVVAPGPAYGGAAYNGGGGRLANAISFGDAPKAIGSGAVGAIAGAIEDIL